MKNAILKCLENQMSALDIFSRKLAFSKTHDASFCLHQGEILGIGGLQGQGQQSFLEVLFGVKRVKGGTLKLDGKPVTLRGPRDAMYILLVHYSGARNEEDVRRAIGPNPYKIKSKTLRKNDVEMAVEIRMKRNNLRFVDALREVEGIKDVTLVQYSGDYID